MSRCGRIAAGVLGPLVLAIAIVASAGAQEISGQARQPEHEFWLAVGASVPTGPLDETARVGFYIQPSFGFSRPGHSLAFRLDGLAARFGGEQMVQAGITARFPSEQIFALTANAVYRLHTGRWTPYFIGGPGAYLQRGYIAQINLGVNAGVGLEFPLGGTRATLEARYHMTVTNNGPQRLRLVPVGVGIRF